MKKVFLGIFSLMLLISCAPSAKFIAPDYSKPASMAILPTINYTTDVTGGIVFRNLFFTKLSEKEYTHLISNENVDSLLNQQGITDGGQLKTIENEELFNLLRVEGLIFIDLLECEYQTLGISEKRKIKATFSLLLPPSKLAWEDEREESRGKSGFGTLLGVLANPKKTMGESADDLKKQVKEKGAKMWLLDHELFPEMEAVINTTLKTLP